MYLKILYICRGKNYLKFSNIFENNLCNLDFGFFLLSLKTFAKVDMLTFKDILKNDFTYDYNYVFMDAKIRISYPLEVLASVFKNKIKSNVSIYLGYDRLIVPQDVIDLERSFNVDYYFIPNLLKDIEKYELPHQLEKKIHNTFHGLGFLNIPYDLKNNHFPIIKTNKDYKFNIFYNGTSYGTNTTRSKVSNFANNLKYINNINVNCYPKQDAHRHRLSPNEYINATRQAKINLVLSGNHNNMTYRFYEVLYLKAFFLIDSGILNYQISDNFENKESFVFENLEQLYTLINFYLKYDDEREFLLTTLLKSFEKIYNPQKHGKEIFNLLFNN
jgi:hypothetical protein